MKLIVGTNVIVNWVKKKKTYITQNSFLQKQNTKDVVPTPENKTGSFQLTLLLVGSSQAIACSQRSNTEQSFDFFKKINSHKSQGRKVAVICQTYFFFGRGDEKLIHRERVSRNKVIFYVDSPDWLLTDHLSYSGRQTSIRSNMYPHFCRMILKWLVDQSQVYFPQFLMDPKIFYAIKTPVFKIEFPQHRLVLIL